MSWQFQILKVSMKEAQLREFKAGISTVLQVTEYEKGCLLKYSCPGDYIVQNCGVYITTSCLKRLGKTDSLYYHTRKGAAVKVSFTMSTLHWQTGYKGWLARHIKSQIWTHFCRCEPSTYHNNRSSKYYSRFVGRFWFCAVFLGKRGRRPIHTGQRGFCC